VEFAALIDIPANVGYVAVFALVAIETMGIPVPAETALIAAALLAHKGSMDIGTLIVVASAAAIIGDNIGFAIGRVYGRRLFLFNGPLLEHRRKLLEVGEPFFAKHGPKAVFLGRWVSGLRIASAWLAGMNRMRWPTFLFWNALGGIAWATGVALSIYFLGHFAERFITVAGPVAAGLAVALLAAFLLWRRRQRRAAPVDARATSSGGEGE
jgi:membrane protein DedA with SNARE-associated domain